VPAAGWTTGSPAAAPFQAPPVALATGHCRACLILECDHPALRERWATSALALGAAAKLEQDEVALVRQFCRVEA
jgi:hypothetical protein